MRPGELGFMAGTIFGLLLGVFLMLLAPGEKAPQCNNGEIARLSGNDWYCGGFTGRYNARFEWRKI